MFAWKGESLEDYWDCTHRIFEFTNSSRYPVGVYTLPKHLDEMVARLQLQKLNAEPTELTETQARYIGISKAGPYKPDHSRY